MVDLYASLVRVLTHDLRRGKHIGSLLGSGKYCKRSCDNWIDLGIDGIAGCWDRAVGKNVEQLVVLIVAKACR